MAQKSVSILEIYLQFWTGRTQTHHAQCTGWHCRAPERFRSHCSRRSKPIPRSIDCRLKVDLSKKCYYDISMRFSRNALTSWYLDFSWCNTLLTLRVMAWPGHMSETSRNQPSTHKHRQNFPYFNLSAKHSPAGQKKQTLDGLVYNFAAHLVWMFGMYESRRDYDDVLLVQPVAIREKLRNILLRGFFFHCAWD